jgi:nucleotide-binding universal stress UspA family protein
MCFGASRAYESHRDNKSQDSNTSCTSLLKGGRVMAITAKAAAVKLERILVATDLSPASLWSLPYVTDIARKFGATVFVAHAMPLGTYVVARSQSFDAIQEECRRGAQEKLDTYSAELKEQGLPVQTLLAEGDIGLVLPEWIKKNHIDLVAVGTTGRSGLRKLALGSIAEEIVRDAECPVLTVGQAAASTAGTKVALRSILYVTDFSADSLRAGAYAISLAEHHRARLTLLHVSNESDVKLSRAALVDRLQRVIPSGSNVSTEALIAEGRPATKVLEIATEHSVDLIVIGVRGAGGLSRAASHFGSTAHDIIVGAPCPVLTTRGT